MLGIYTRLSVEDGASNSIKNQLLEGESFAKKNKLTYQIYNEGEGLSGKLGFEDRPQLKKLFEDIIEGKITQVWFRDSNRLSRNELLYHRCLETFRKQEIEVYFGDKHFDYNSPTANAMQSIKAAFDAMKLFEQSVATKKAIKGRLERGEVQGTIPLGYKSDNGKLVIDETNAPIVKEVFNKSLSGVGTNQIAEWLTNEGVPTKISKSNKWKHTAVHKIITNPIYKGIRTYGGTDYSSPIIIDEILWNKTNEHLQTMKQYTGKPTHHKYLLSNILKCGRCGSKVSGRKLNQYNKDKSIKYSHHSYACISSRYKKDNCYKPSINMAILEDLIWAKLIGDNRLSELVISHFKSSSKDDKLTELKDNLKTLESSKKKLNRDKDKLVQLVLDEVLSNEDVRSKMGAIKIKIKDTDISISNIKEQIQSYEGSLNNLDNILSDLNIGKEYSFNDKQSVIKKYIKEITLYHLEGHHFIDIAFNIVGMDNVTYVMDKEYKYAYKLIDLKSWAEKGKKAFREGSETFNIPMETIVWDESYKETGKLSIDILTNAYKVFTEAKN